MTDIEDMDDLDQEIYSYYENYYRDQLGLPDWRWRTEHRLRETNSYGGLVLDRIESWLNFSFLDKRILVAGGGTGAETFEAYRRGADVTAIDPSPEAARIIKSKAYSRFDTSNPAILAVCEHLPYMENSFDLVISHTVLEHTQDPAKCIDEMLRVVRPEGWMFLVAPDYRHLYEPHYKMVMPTFAPRWVQRLYLRLRGKPSHYLNSLQYVNSRKLTRMFQMRPVTAMQVIHSWPQQWLNNPTKRQRLAVWMTNMFGFQPDQFWCVQKLRKPR